MSPAIEATLVAEAEAAGGRDGGTVSVGGEAEAEAGPPMAYRTPEWWQVCNIYYMLFL